ncbi:HAMP domain-containing sensor histidine kinase [Achromobacter sp. NFACC18-2]|uniref:sensor histidine kinase n=1 Tax=Achromobacter sp. NFACC18-2 TaxID=1564112 RepID=UPI0008C17DDF|nr:HAMP domain-containing sensor histidine kinase [Achromobacter sp. NFACC18-2]SEI59610.1 Signal transduction histidine kinase [Achromobacter sp. NFACC18-2]
MNTVQFDIPETLRALRQGPLSGLFGSWQSFWRDARAPSATAVPPPTRTTSHFRYTACFAFIFLLVTLGSIAWGQNLLEHVMVRHVKDMVAAEIRAHQTLSSRDSASELARALKLREAAVARRERAISVQAADGRLLYGAAELLSPLMCQGGQQPCRGWLRASLTTGEGASEWLGHASLLPDGGRYVIAYDILPMLNRIYPVPLVVGLSVFTALLLSLGAGLLFSIGAANRVTRIRQTMARFARGDQDARVALHGSQDEFDELGHDVNQALERIDFLMEEVRNATNHIAHELRTPLTRLQQRLSNAADSMRDNPAAEAEMALAEEEVRRILYLFRTVMRISEIETGRCHHEPVDLDARALLADLHDYYDVLADQRGVALQIRVEDDLPLMGDRALLFQALVNLIDNAIKYAPPGSAITLLARRRGPWIELGTADQGPGIDADQRSQAVQRFRRLTRDRTISGHGLGLALVHAVAALHGGSLALADNDPGPPQGAASGAPRGLLAILRLPCKSAAGGRS